MARLYKVGRIITPTKLFTDGRFYYGIVSNMILRTKHPTGAIFHTEPEAPLVSDILTKYGVDHEVKESSYRNKQIYIPRSLRKAKKAKNPGPFCIIVEDSDLVELRKVIFKSKLK